jgi:hypothetical protein
MQKKNRKPRRVAITMTQAIDAAERAGLIREAALLMPGTDENNWRLDKREP